MQNSDAPLLTACRQLNRYRWLAAGIFLAVLVVAGLLFTLLPKTHQATADVLLTVESPQADTIPEMLTDPQLENQGHIMRSEMVGQRAKTLLKELAQTRTCQACSELIPGYRFKKLSADTDIKSIGTLSGGLSVERQRPGSVFHLSYHAKDVAPADLPQILAIYLTAYQLEANAMAERFSKTQASVLKQQLHQADDELLAAGQALKDFQLSNQLYDLDAQVSQWVMQHVQLEESIRMLESDIKTTESRMASMQKQLSLSPMMIKLMDRLSHDQETLGLRQQISLTQADKAHWLSQVADDHPKIVALDEQMGHLYSLLQTRLNALQKEMTGLNLSKLDAKALPAVSGLDLSVATDLIYQQLNLTGLKARYATSQALAGEVLQKLEPVPDQQLSYAQLDANWKLAQEKTNRLQGALNELLQTQAESASFTARWLQPPTLSEPIQPHATRYWVWAFLAALGLALTAVGLMSRLDQSIKDVAQIQRMTDRPVLSLQRLPGESKIKQQLEGHIDHHAVPLSFQQALIYLGRCQQEAGRRIGLMPVSRFSGAPGAGLLLSLHLADLGHKLVLVDTDFGPYSLSTWIRTLSVPVVSEGLANNPGLGDYLDERVEDFVDMICPLGKTVFGSLIPAGRLDAGETGLHFTQKNLTQLEADLSPNYEYVMYALPSLHHSFDAVSVGRMLDGVLLIAHRGITTEPELQQAISSLRDGGVNLLGVFYQA